MNLDHHFKILVDPQTASPVLMELHRDENDVLHKRIVEDEELAAVTKEEFAARLDQCGYGQHAVNFYLEGTDAKFRVH